MTISLGEARKALMGRYPNAELRVDFGWERHPTFGMRCAHEPRIEVECGDGSVIIYDAAALERLNA